MKAENTFQYNSPKYKDLLKEFRQNDGSKHMLIVFAGAFDSNRNAAVDELKREIIGEPVEIDLTEIVTPYEEESYAQIDAHLNDIPSDSSLVIFRNAEQLNGVYTAFSASITKYATPQEKYLLNKIKDINCPVLLEFNDLDQLDRTVTRTADSVVLFNPPSSLLESIAWKIKNLHVHGSRFLSPRPH
ncbi:MAG: hypothetical protein CL666_07760 [Balneola sp.]|nr:hypothetical protein [Balneola sp.]|tara:strand:- start:34655 stop:35215 length:561 start_codon:yes stop_codon:yes gene_type:complete